MRRFQYNKLTTYNINNISSMMRKNCGIQTKPGFEHTHRRTRKPKNTYAPALFPCFTALSMRCWYCSCWAADKISDGLVVASVGLCAVIAIKMKFQAKQYKWIKWGHTSKTINLCKIPLRRVYVNDLVHYLLVVVVIVIAIVIVV